MKYEWETISQEYTIRVRCIAHCVHRKIQKKKARKMKIIIAIITAIITFPLFVFIGGMTGFGLWAILALLTSNNISASNHREIIENKHKE